MNEIIKTALAEALTAAEEAQTAAQAGNFAEARALLEVVEAGLNAGETRNPALVNRRLKIIRIQASVEALLPAAEPVVEAPAQANAEPALEPEVEAAPVAEPAQEPEAAPVDEPAPAPVALPAPAETELPPVAQADAPAKVRGVAAPHALPDEGWDRVAAALRAQGTEVEAREADAARHKRLQGDAEEARDTWRARVEERFALQAQLEVCALRGDYAGANAAWDRLFDVVTAIRSREGAARRRGLPEAAAMRPVFEAANEDSKQVRQWARGKGADAA
ncbi:hypothetical protein [Deinococcus soli (ex Cha et al. 2016)]|uniref:Uncharacterized protein n=1 Tax=Deinococcus soli (ex Cha et al. 2016) TaxID=1309411 RepID=A0ACC6KPH2_9DEIO|nr:hypothetical protein [Deinococcus soli (ex Cha et al. 2016)]MDR6330567.1 hypothetical protein [Deinococcus soli (ex Cha et al. 2016)]MDR6754344.1 hypothetical protein [Deinococcus soli (ex Cha et al. 2016)]